MLITAPAAIVAGVILLQLMMMLMGAVGPNFNLRAGDDVLTFRPRSPRRRQQGLQQQHPPPLLLMLLLPLPLPQPLWTFTTMPTFAHSTRKANFNLRAGPVAKGRDRPMPLVFLLPLLLLPLRNLLPR